MNERHYGDDNGARKHPERLLRGEDSPNAKLTSKKVKSIRRWREAGMSLRKIAKKVNISHVQVSRVLNGISWRHVAD